jgi:hypothetical protein
MVTAREMFFSVPTPQILLSHQIIVKSFDLPSPFKYIDAAPQRPAVFVAPTAASDAIALS